MTELRRVVLDVLKPHDPPLLTFTERISDTESVDGVTTSLIELDQEVQNVRLTIEGDPLDYDEVKATIDRLGGSIHSVDQASYGTSIINEPNHADFG